MRELPYVLLVDDDSDTREMYAWCLESRGLRVAQAATAARALAIAMAGRPDLIVTDFTLPGGDGFSLAQGIRDSRILAETPMILVSGRAFMGGADDRAARLFDRVLLKPVFPDHLIGEIVPLLLARTMAGLQAQLRHVRAEVRSAAGRDWNVPRVIAIVDGLARASVAPVAALVADSSARYVGVNDAACVLTGRSRDELLTLRVWDLTPGVSRADAHSLWDAFVAGGSLEGSYALATAHGDFVNARFAASAHLLPDRHLSLLQPIPASFVAGSAE